MKCKCIKADPLGWLKVGHIYSLYKTHNVYMIEGKGFAVNPDSFKEMFEPINNQL
jgi:hypothetical protein